LIRLVVIASETREESQNSKRIPREFDLTAVQGHPRSSILVSIESPYVTDFILVINSKFSRICYRFRDIHGQRLKADDFTHPSLV